MTLVPTVQALPHVLPDCANARIALFAMRRMGAHGLSDALAAHAVLTAFGEGYRRPLLLLRNLMMEMASMATSPIAIAPCCCPRMTPAESALVTILDRVNTAPQSAGILLEDLLGVRRADTVFTSAAAVAAAFNDAGRPIRA